MLEVTTSLIRFWEQEFTHIRPRKNGKGDRRYTRKDIDDIKQVYILVKEKGYTLLGAKEFIRGKKDKKNDDIIKTLSGLKQLLLEVRAQLPDTYNLPSEDTSSQMPA
jgi:DNA-binding transcriptional MerR regulator